VVLEELIVVEEKVRRGSLAAEAYSKILCEEACRPEAQSLPKEIPCGCGRGWKNFRGRLPPLGRESPPGADGSIPSASADTSIPRSYLSSDSLPPAAFVGENPKGKKEIWESREMS